MNEYVKKNCRRPMTLSVILTVGFLRHGVSAIRQNNIIYTVHVKRGAVGFYGLDRFGRRSFISHASRDSCAG